LNLGGNYAIVPADFIDPKTGRHTDLSRVLDDVRNLQTKQSSLSDKLSYMQTENQALWNEIGTLRQKHNKQQQIVSKLMEFLLHILSANSAQTHEQHVHQQSPHEVLDTDLHHQQTHQTQTTHLTTKVYRQIHSNENMLHSCITTNQINVQLLNNKLRIHLISVDNKVSPLTN